MLICLLLVVSACTADRATHSPRSAPTGDRAGCGPLAFDDVRGRPPTYLDEDVLDRFQNDQAVCAGVWLRTEQGFVPQGVAVAGSTAWVSGFDGSAPLHHRACILQRVDLRTGRLLDRLAPVTGQVGDRDPVSCRHGGGLVRDEHGLWLVETRRLWLIDPDTLTVDRVWALAAPLRGSFALLDGDGRLGIGRWHPHRRAQVDWYHPDELVGSTALNITTARSDGSSSAPPATQGAVWGRFGGEQPGPWFARSVTRCAILVGPRGTHRRAFVPGAEGMDLVGADSMWVVSESGAQHYQDQGGRPVVPMLVRLDVSDLASWRRPDCSV